MRSQPGGNRFVRPGGAGVGPGAIRAETGGDYVSVANPLNCDGSHNSSLGVLIVLLKMAAAAVADVKL